MATPQFIRRCLTDTLRGLREGLSLFTGADSRVAVIFSTSPEAEPMVFDPQGILSEHTPKIKAILQKPELANPEPIQLNALLQEHGIELDGIVSYGGPSQALTYQAWFTEYHPTMCSPEPIECWLEHAMQCISNDIESPSEVYTGISGNFLREYSTHAVRDALVDKITLDLGIDVHMRLYPILHAILEISKFKEEGALPYGKILFAEPRLVLKNVRFLAKFATSDQPMLTNHKHVRKTLQAVESSDSFLVSDGTRILGVCKKAPPHSLVASFHGKLGFLEYDGKLVASLNNACFCNNTFRAKLVEAEEILLDYPLDDKRRTQLFQIIEHLVHNCQDRGFGACFIIDLKDEITAISGQSLDPPINLSCKAHRELAGALAKVDGAVHIRDDLKMHAFACLLDGARIENENAARGARYNSALRFSSHNRDNIVVVVSSDRPVSVIYRGKEILRGNSTVKDSLCMLAPKNIYEWLDEMD